MLITLEKINFKYRNLTEYTLKDVSFQVKAGKIMAVLGESGSGKSTILRVIAGLETPETGSIIINHKTVFNDRLFIPAEKRGIGMVFQDYALFPHMTVEKNISFGIEHFKIKERKKRIREMLELVDMTGYEKRYPYELSGGQQQRIALARSIAPGQKVLLLDEPFSNLDAHLQSTIRNEIKEIVKNAGITTIFVTHDKTDVEQIADDFITIRSGYVQQI